MNITGGEILGSVYGGGRLGSVGYGLFDSNETGYGEMRADTDTETGFSTSGFFTKGRGHVDITISGGTIGNDYEDVIPNTDDNTAAGITAAKAVADWDATDWDNWKKYKNIPYTEFVYDDNLKLYRLSHTKGGNVFAGGMGRLYQLDGTTPISAVDWWKLGNVKSTKLTISGNTTLIKGNVYGGGELGMVQGTHTSATNKAVSTEIIINGGTIGREIQETVTVPGETPTTEKQTRYTFGSVCGGGYGSLVEKLDHTGSTNTTYTSANYYYTYPKYIAGRVKGSTEVTITGGEVKASVYGGGEMASVGESLLLKNDPDQTILGETLTGADGKAIDGNTYVSVSGGTIGIPNVGETLFGGATMGNVYGGGSGHINIVRSGQIYGNTNVTVSQAEGKTTQIYHNIYGGGAYGTVGDFTYAMREETVGNVTTKKVNDIKGLHTDRTGTGTATVTITGGTIGIDGHENGMIFGSSRGDVDEPGKRPDFLAWVNNANVTIGTKNETAGPLIRGSVYGSGENGHTYNNTLLNIYSGTIGNPAEYYEYRGNVYGAGCGTDTYTKSGQKLYNPWAGIVRGNTEVNIDGGVIAGNVYGAGAMASVGTITNVADTATVAKHHDITDEGTQNEVVHGFALSWPYKFVFAEGTGKATVNITGGHIGIEGTYGGDVYGSARGEAADRYKMAHLAYVKETEVNVNYPTTVAVSDVSDMSKECIVGSVHGSGENGYVYGDTKVTLNNGLIGHSLYGGGKGIGTYKKMLPVLEVEGTGEKERDIYGLLSGKVMGNTYVTMNGGHVVRNVYGGGNMGSVGKGNYAGGADDYYPTGYGETLTGNLWDNESDDSKAFLSSGKTNVNVIGGTVGYVDASNPENSTKNNLPYGNVIGGSAGESAPNIVELPRYLYCPAFFSGYVNETDVTIGGYKCKTAYGDYKVDDYITAAQYNALASDNQANWELTGPTILASVYGGGQDGHVRRDTKVTVLGGEIGLPYTSGNQTLLKTSNIDSDQWLHRGNIYGGGSGISKYEYHFNDDDDFDDEETYQGKLTKERDYSNSSGSVTRFTEVNILGGTIHRNVYGGCSMGSVGAPKINQNYDLYKKDLNNTATLGKQSQNTVIIGGGKGIATIGSPTGYNILYGGEVYGACRGDATLDADQFGTSIWTQVLIKNGANILGNVYGGGDNGKVKKDTDVQIGDQ